MSNLIRKRETWNDRATKEMLLLIKNKYLEDLFNKKLKRNQPIYERISKELRSKGIDKTAEQIRTKFKFLKTDFSKLKRNSKPTGRQTSDLFEILDEVFSHSGPSSPPGVETSREVSETDENDCELKKNLSEFLESPSRYNPQADESFEILNEVIPNSPVLEPTNNNFNMGENPENMDDDPLEAIGRYKRAASENPSDEEKYNPPSKFMRTFKKPKSNSYVKVVQSFTKEWKNTQENMLLQMKEQDKQYMESLQQMLEINRTETAKILEEDRKETRKMLTTFINMMQPQSERNWQPQLNISRPVVNFNVSNYSPSSTTKPSHSDIDTTVS